MSKVLLSHSYYYQLDPKQWNTGMPYPPLGTIFAASYLRENGFEVSLFDVCLKTGPEAIETIIQKEQPEYFVLYDDGFNYLTKMCLTNMREAAFKMLQIAKKYQCKVIVSSSDSTDHFQQYIENGADVVLLGEGELSLLETIQKFQNNEVINEVKGICFQNEGEIINTGRRAVIRDLDILPQPAWDLVDIDAYKKVWKAKGNAYALNIATTRGCPYQCNWCAKPIYGNRYNSRSPKRVVEEIKLLKAQFGVTNFWMCDDIFGLKPNWVQEFDQYLKQEDLAITYKIQSRADLLLKEDNIDALVSSGLKEVWIGAESGSQRILDAMDKGTTIEQIEKATQLLQSKGVRVAFFLQFGYLGETKEEVEETIDMLLRCMPDDIGVSVSYPLPGTKFYDMVSSELGQKANWEDSDDLALMFSNTFNQAYYKTLHRYVHKVFRNEQAKERKAIGKQLYYAPIIQYYKYKLKQLSNRV
ncbi:MAG: B12-binding domain-containing radical SAM protein [Flavobacteriales bacterium]|jgi:anaerobic magnesium-protoporphyrin IX monomethyl ester cyclase|nr:B12-binding domain-containing radical SAM protein [Flavobacteriales bacterium]